MATYQDDYRDQQNPGTDNDQLGENTEQTPLANAVNRDAENQGWGNNKPGITAENVNDQRIPTITPDNDNLHAGPGNLVDDNRIMGAMDPQDAGYSPDEDDDDLVDDDDDLLDDDNDDDLIPVETDDDDDLDLDDDDLGEDDDLDPLADRPTTFEADPDFASRDHGRTTGTMLDHEPGLPGSGNTGPYNL